MGSNTGGFFFLFFVFRKKNCFSAKAYWLLRAPVCLVLSTDSCAGRNHVMNVFAGGKDGPRKTSVEPGLSLLQQSPSSAMVSAPPF